MAKTNHASDIGPDATNLIFLDLETTGLSDTQDRIIEIACLPVNSDMEPLDKGFSSIVYPGPIYHELLRDLPPRVLEMHTANGLLAELAGEDVPGIATVERQVIQYIERFVPRTQTPMAGSSIGFDRGFLKRYMPGVEAWFHYRNADVSAVKEYWKRWFPEIGEPPKEKRHRALDDCYGSLAEAVWYRDQIQLRIEGLIQAPTNMTIAGQSVGSIQLIKR